MKAFDNIHPLALGTNRFLISGANDLAGIEESARMVLRALDAGVNYIDTAHAYSNAMAHAALKLAFSQTKKPYYLTVKSKFDIDKDASGALSRVETSFEQMGIDHASHFLCWSIMSYEEFEIITRPGGIYEAANRLKSEGMIDHICFSTHAPVPDIIRILESGAFEGMTISFSMLNSNVMLPALGKAYELGIGVTAMNPLGGGIIPQNRDYFGFARAGEESTVQAALRYAAAHRAINAVIAGPSSIEQLDECIAAFTSENDEQDTDRIERVNSHICKLENFCTGCNYCADCPKGIPISKIMQSRNALLFNPVKAYKREEPELLKNIQFFRKLAMDLTYIPETAENPCIRCGKCEKSCTQKLPVTQLLDDSYKRMKKTNFSKSGQRDRLNELLHGRKKIGFYSSGGYMVFILSQYRRITGEQDSEVILFDSNPALWGQVISGLTVHPPSDIPIIAPEAILVCNYNYETEIYNSLSQYAENGIEILKLHGPDDVPWVF